VASSFSASKGQEVKSYEYGWVENVFNFEQTKEKGRRSKS
jgi:hypothetical protein